MVMDRHVQIGLRNIYSSIHSTIFLMIPTGLAILY